MLSRSSGWTVSWAAVLGVLVAVWVSGCASMKIPPQPAAPAGLSYAQPSVTAVVNQAMSPDVPQLTGTASSYAVSPRLPAGLTLDATTGTIAGTPTVVSAGRAYTVTVSNAAGSATTTVQIAVQAAVAEPPTHLVYPQAEIDGYVSLAIAADTPQVTGTVDSYEVSPVLPAGLVLDLLTGTISGAPAATQTAATYTVTARNAAGSTTATVQIAVAVAPAEPSGLAYPQTTISTYVGREITPDLPATAGAVTSWRVDPALPPGLRLDGRTGVIYGTPTAAAPEATYTITGANVSGSLTAQVSVTVHETPVILAQVNNDWGYNLQFAGNRVLSEGAGIWMLWNYSTGGLVASGDNWHGTGGNSGFWDTPWMPQIARMAGGTLALGVPGGIEVRSAGTGALLSIIVSPGYGISDATGKPQQVDAWDLAPDGSFVAIETMEGLYAYAPDGRLLCSKAGYYLGTSARRESVFVAPGKILVANGPAASNAVETFTVPGGVSTISPPYQGDFYTWSGDGKRFFSQYGYVNESGQTEQPGSDSRVWIYSSAGELQSVVQPPYFYHLGGWGKWMWLAGYSDQTNYSYFSVYRMGSMDAVLTTGTRDPYTQISGGTVAIFPHDASDLGIVDLSGAQPVEKEYTVPLNRQVPSDRPYGPGDYAAGPQGKWVAATDERIVDGASLGSEHVRFFGNGSVTSIAGSSGTVAVATGDGKVTLYDPANATATGSVDMYSGQVELSTDGSVLAAGAESGLELNFYALPSGALIQGISYPDYDMGELHFDLAGSGSNVAITLVPTIHAESSAYEVRAVAGGSPILSSEEAGGVPAVISPDGTLVAVTNEDVNSADTVSIFRNGSQVAKVSGLALGWVDNGRLLVANFDWKGIEGATIYSPTGKALGNPPLPKEVLSPFQMAPAQGVSTDVVYFPSLNAMYSLSTGKRVWSSPYPGDMYDWGQMRVPGAVAGPYVVFESEGKIIAVRY